MNINYLKVGLVVVMISTILVGAMLCESILVCEREINISGGITTDVVPILYVKVYDEGVTEGKMTTLLDPKIGDSVYVSEDCDAEIKITGLTDEQVEIAYRGLESGESRVGCKEGFKSKVVASGTSWDFYPPAGDTTLKVSIGFIGRND